jgi:hypothetical protein
MLRFFLHLRDGTDELLDPEGKEFPNLESMRSFVLASARDVMSSDMKAGVVDLRFRIDAEDAGGQVIYSLPFKHAVNIIPDE